MTQPSPQNEPPEPSVAILVLKGILLIIGAFLSAAYILVLHFPAGH